MFSAPVKSPVLWAWMFLRLVNPTRVTQTAALSDSG